ncbi:hypothetical protein ACIO52_02935 [Nocardia sp. NPDC087230]|uniref:hypothetical protein n=1 Tax=Nocardia sp. NPDC087230 TaxID=3364331 RepID=UPI003814478F
MSEAHDRVKRLRQQYSADATAHEAHRSQAQAACDLRTAQRMRDLRDILTAEHIPSRPLYSVNVVAAADRPKPLLRRYGPGLDLFTYTPAGAGWSLRRPARFITALGPGFWTDDEHARHHPLLTTRGEIWSVVDTDWRNNPIEQRGLTRGRGYAGAVAAETLGTFGRDGLAPIGNLDDAFLTHWYLMVIDWLTEQH